MRAMLNFELKVPVEVYKGSPSYVEQNPPGPLFQRGRAAGVSLLPSFSKGGWGDLNTTSLEACRRGFWPRLFHCPSVAAARKPNLAPAPCFLTARIFTTISNLSFY